MIRALFIDSLSVSYITLSGFAGITVPAPSVTTGMRGLYSSSVVSNITAGSTHDPDGRPFVRRRYRPGIVALVVLLTMTGLAWAFVLTRPVQIREAAGCNPPPSRTDATGPKLGQLVSGSSLIDVAPAKLADTKIRVLNASGQGGQAGEVASALRDLGFAAPNAANDPIYAGTRLSCQGQIRFGPTGRPSAAAAWLVAPCVELYQDDREDDSVDLVIGTDFTALSNSDDIATVLTGLRPGATEPADSALITKIHNSTC